VNLGKLPVSSAAPVAVKAPAGGWVSIGSVASPRASRLPPRLPMLRRASPLAHYRRARPAAAMTIRNATTGLNGTNAPMTVPTPQSEHCSLADPACVLTDGSYAPFSPCLTDEPSNGIGEA